MSTSFRGLSAALVGKQTMDGEDSLPLRLQCMTTRIVWLNVEVRIESRLPEDICPLSSLALDFAALNDASKPVEKAALFLHELGNYPAIAETTFIPLWRWKGKKIGRARFHNKWRRVIQFADGSRAWVDDGLECIHFFPKTSNAAYETSFLYVIALLGERLERLGFVRLHGAGFSKKGKEDHLIAVLADSGCGKSCLSYLVFQSDQYSVGADEILFWRDNRFFPLPLPLSVPAPFLMRKNPCSTLGGLRARNWQASKRIIPLLPTKPQSHSVATITVLFENRTPGLLTGLSAKCRLLFRVVSGIGLPQMMEVYLRAHALPLLLRVLRSRLVLASRILSGRIDGQIINFYVSLDDPDRSQKVFDRIMSGDSASISIADALANVSMRLR